MREGITFSDVLIVPKYSDIDTRQDVDVKSFYLGQTRLPIVSAPMDYVTGPEMALTMSKLGAFGIINRFGGPIPSSLHSQHDVGIAVGAKDLNEAYWRFNYFRDAIHCFSPNFNSVCIDVAHGDHEQVIKAIKFWKNQSYGPWNIIAGNVATLHGFIRLAEAGADAIRVGIGAGSVCSTRENTGVGVPQLTAILECARAKEFYPHVALIADGGIQNPGDIAKALAAGADAVMLGKMLAGHDESPGDIIDLPPGKYKKYRGQSLLGTNAQRNAPEGVEGLVEYKGPVKDTVDSLMHYLRSSMSYTGARNLTEFRKRVEFIKVSPSTLQESNTRI